jgi:hypothetical protein
MFWLIKWALIFFLLAGAWYSYDFVRGLDPEQRHELKLELVGALDGDPEKNLKGPMVQKAKEELLCGFKNKLKNLVHKILD